jgi:hypothetical protein
MGIGDALFSLCNPVRSHLIVIYLALTFDLVYSTFIYLRCQTPRYGRDPFSRLPTCTTTSHGLERSVVMVDPEYYSALP